MDYYGYTDYNVADTIVVGILIIYAIIGIVALVVSIIQIIGYWKTLKKAGKGGWEALIPFYNNWVLVEISGLNWWWFLLFFAPFVLGLFDLSVLGYLVGAVASFNCYYNLAKRFNKGVGFAICLTLFTPICMAILGLSKNCVYDRSIPVSKNGVFGQPEVNNGNNNNNYNNYQQPQMYNNAMNNNYNNVPPVQQNSMNNEQISNVNNTQEQEFKFCGNCGTKLNNDVKFCPNCGKENL